jgi:hypothetical protein
MAEDVSATRSTPEGLTGQVRRRRPKIFSLFAAPVLVVVALAAIVPMVLSGGGGAPSAAHGAPSVLPSYKITVNGQSGVRIHGWSPAHFNFRHGDRLSITVAVEVPGRLRITKLWLGIAGSRWQGGVPGRPAILMHPILAISHRPLPPGVHDFTMDWRIPEDHRRAPIFLMADFTGRHPTERIGEAVALLVR